VDSQIPDALEQGISSGEASRTVVSASHDAGAPGRRLDSVPINDLIIDKPSRTSTNRGWVWLHVIGIGYMLLGLNTVCDIYFTGALEVMVARWKVKPDVAGATFMAAGGSAPELFTSFIGTLVVENDVGFGTIVGSAVFNVLFVIGVCGFLASEEIKLTFWPLIRDCTYYILGLGLLAIFASDECIVLWEALVLFGAYLLYCILMYNNAKLEALTDFEFQRARQITSSEGSGQFKPVHPQCTSPPGFGGPVHKVIGAWEAPSEKTPTSAAFDLAGESVGTPDPVLQPLPALQGCALEGAKGSQEHAEDGTRESHSSRLSTWPARGVVRHSSGARVHGKVRGSYIQGQVVAERHEQRMASLGGGSGAATPHGAAEPQPSMSDITPSIHPSMDAEEIESAEERSRPPSKSSKSQLGKEDVVPEAEDEDDDGDLMQKPEGTANLILWYLSLPIYVPLYFLMPKPSERWFLATFFLSLLWIAGFNFFLVCWVEILGEVCHVPYIVMSFTVLAAGTSIPDLVSSVAVARNGEGDMAISSSIGSNIFDILFGLPIPWIIKTGIVEGGSTVNIISPFLAFHVLLLLFMVFMVILCIHCIGWKLNKVLGLMMAFLYAIFVATVISIEVMDPPPVALQF